MSRVIAVALIVCTLGCGLVPERVSFDDPRVVKLLAAVQAVDRASMGFTPIERTAALQLEWRPRAGYDAMLHVYGKTRRTIAFRRHGESYDWIHEQETFDGPKEYDSPDGRFHESITITWESVPIATHSMPLRQLNIDYWGDDRELSGRATGGKLTLEDVRPVLNAWGY